ncbi:hypothetical protein HQ576_06830, partial [bacterium]|nr:hypothetical protein [bacterium]
VYHILRAGPAEQADAKTVVVADNVAEDAFSDAPADDGTYEYHVVAVDAVGNASAESQPATVSFASILPTATLTLEPPSPARSTFRVVLASTQPLQGEPEVFLHFAHGKPIRVRFERRGDTAKEWVASVPVSENTPNGPARFTFLGTSKAGHKGSRIRSGETLVIDTRPPAATLALQPGSPLQPGKVKVALHPSEPLKDIPTLTYTTMGAKARRIALTKEKDGFVGEFEITDQDQDGVAFCTFSGIDAAGNVGSRLHGARFVVDNHPPKPPAALKATTKPRGYVQLEWRPPLYRANETQDDIVGYNVYATEAEPQSVKGLKPVAARIRRIPADVLLPGDGTWFVTLTTVDATGIESAPCKAVACTADRTPPPPPAITEAKAEPNAIRLAWQAADDAKSFAVYVHVPGERDPRRVAEKVEEKTFTYTPLMGGRYAAFVVAYDALGHGSRASTPATVEFAQDAPLALIALPGASLGLGTHTLAVETTRPLVRAPKLRFIPEAAKGDPEAQAASPPIDITLEGAAKTWSGTLAITKDVKGATARFEYEGVAMVDGKEVTGRAILRGDRASLDFGAPTAAIVFAQPPGERDRKAVLAAGRYPFALRASEPLAADPTLTFTPRGKDTQTLALARQSDTEWAGVLVVAKELGDGSGLFEFAGVDRQGNAGDLITHHKNVEIDTTRPRKIARIRAVPLPGGKVRVDWVAPYTADDKLDTDANTFRLYRSESEIKDITGAEPRKVVQKTLGTFDHSEADRDYYYAVVAVDTAGNVGELSACARCRVDKTAPNPPHDLRVNQLESGVVHLSWQPPKGDKPLYYNVYLADHPILSTTGLAPKNPGVTWTEIYGTPNENGTYYFAVTSVDSALNESDPCKSVHIKYTGVGPLAKFKIHPDIWLRDGEHKVTLTTTKSLAGKPTVVINSQHGKRYPIAFDGTSAEWTATLKIDDTYPEGTYGFIFRGKDADGIEGKEIWSGPLFHVDKTPPLPPGQLAVKPDSKGTPGAVVLSWFTPKREGQQTEVPHFYNLYRDTKPIPDLKGRTPIHTLAVEFENLDDYHHTDMPPANGTYHYVATSLDMARNESGPSNDFKVTVHSDAPRATLDLFVLDKDGQASPVPTNDQGVPIMANGKYRLKVATTSPLQAAPKLHWHIKRQDDQKTAIAMAGQGAAWQGDFALAVDFEDEKTAFFTFEGASDGGTKGTFIRKGDRFRIDTTGPVAEIIIPSAYKMKVNVKANKLEAPPVRGGIQKLTLTTPKELAAPPKLTYTLDGGKPVAIPLTGFGGNWQGFVDFPASDKPQQGKFQYEGTDRAGNTTTTLAKRRYPYDVDDTVFPPRKIASYATTGGAFVADALPPEAPTDVETEMRKLGIAVIKWKEPAGEPQTYNLYRALTPITGTGDLKPIKTDIYATLIVDDPPVDGNYFYAVTALDMAGNEGELSETKSVFIDTIKPELKIEAVPSGDDFVILMDDDAPQELSLTINFPGQKSMKVQLGGSSGELKKYSVRTVNGRRGIVLPQMAEFFNGRVEVIVHSPDPEGNMVEEKTEVEMKKISTATGGEVSSTDAMVQLIIPPGLKPVIPKGPNESTRVGGYENLFFVQYANIPNKKPEVKEGEKRRPDQVDPLPPGLEVVGKPYVIHMNNAPEAPLELRASASQVDFSQLKTLTAKLKMKIPATIGSEAVEDADYLKSRLKVVKWVPARSDDEPPRWVFVPDIEVDVKNKEIIVPASEITTYVIVSERTPPSIRDMKPGRGGVVSSFRPEISCLVVDKGTGVAVGAENRIVLSIDGKPVEKDLVKLSKGDPTEVSVSYTPAEDLAPGTHIIGIRAEDVVENVANVKWQFTIDDKPPKFLAVLPDPDSRLPVARPLIQARVHDAGGIDASRTRLTIDGQAIALHTIGYDEPAGLLTLTLPRDLESGRHKAELLVHDRTGQSSKHAWSFVTDLEPPSVTSILPAPDSTVSDKTASFALEFRDTFGRVRPLDVRVDGVKIPPAEHDAKKGFAFNPAENELTYTARGKPFAEGEHRVAVLFADDLGNTATRTWTFTSKAGAPEAKALSYDVKVESPRYRAVRREFSDYTVALDRSHIAAYAPEALEEATTLSSTAEALAREKKFEESAAKFSEAKAKLAAAEKQATQREHEALEVPKEKLTEVREKFTALDEKVDKKLVEEYGGEPAKQVATLVKQAEALAQQARWQESTEKYEEAARKLAVVETKARENKQRLEAEGKAAAKTACSTAAGQVK